MWGEKRECEEEGRLEGGQQQPESAPAWPSVQSQQPVGNLGPFFLSHPKALSKHVQQESQASGSRSASESQGSWALLRKFSSPVEICCIQRGFSLDGAGWPLASIVASHTWEKKAQEDQGKGRG
ncbi:hypothetical protein E2C01_087766 [Portunus trituberculatus]|uniref:Uncharacterized protein n=1 Tax=Portunus trituberculatus TaxID=210409 RepID=A0A5B7JE88_PORTR|nr:hypothetical protein [Portunus trituberculatus]